MSKAFFTLLRTISCILLLIALAASALICFRSPEPKIKLKEVFSISAEKENTIQIACVGNSYRDNGNHLNYYGAKAVTAYIGNFLNNTYSLMSFKDNQYFDYWNEDYKHFQRNIT